MAYDTAAAAAAIFLFHQPNVYSKYHSRTVRPGGRRSPKLEPLWIGLLVRYFAGLYSQPTNMSFAGDASALSIICQISTDFQNVSPAVSSICLTKWLLKILPHLKRVTTLLREMLTQKTSNNLKRITWWNLCLLARKWETNDEILSW